MPIAHTCLRIQDKHKEIIDYAAKFCGKTRTDFIIESAVEKAKAILLEQTHFSMDPEDWDKFIKMLDQPPVDNPGLQKLLNSIPPWERL